MTLTLVFSVPAETTKPSDKEYGKLEGLTGKADSVETKKAIDTEGTAEAVAYDKIAAISRSEIENILKGE